MDSRTITLTEDASVRQKLRRKLTEYEARSEASRPPERNPLEAYKRIILCQLLRKRTVSYNALRAELCNDEWFDGEKYTSAFNIIAIYNAGSTVGILDGTGLR